MRLQNRWLHLFVTFASLMLLAGCSPEFTSDNCVSDRDCFAGQSCNSRGFCVDAPAAISSFTANPATVEAGSATTLSWETSAAASATITTEAGFEYEVPTSDLESGETIVADIQQDTTFTLTVTGSTGTASATATVELVASAPPTIVEFSADETDVAAGSTVLLSWSVTDADSISIEQDGVEITTSTDATGTFQVTVDQQTSFILRATNSAGDTTSDPIVITLLGAPTITSFTAMPATDIVPGSMIQLSWIVEDAGLIVITDSSDTEIGRSTNGDSDLMTMVTADETFTLTATNDAGDTVETVSVTTTAVPTINDFSASEQTDVVPGTTIDLSWDVMDADTITIEDASGNLITSSTNATGTAQALVNADETYTLTAENVAGEVSEQLAITVLVGPTINDFSASETSDIVPGTTIDLTWDVTGADTVTITDSSGTVLNTATSSTGTYAATVSGDETFTLTASNGAGDTTQDISVTVLPTPTITLFSSSQNTDVVPGAMVTLTWDTTGADAIAIVDSGGTTLFTSTMAAGSFQLTVNSNTTVTLEATNAAGTASSMPVQITLLGSPVVSTFSASQSTDVVAGSNITLTWATTDADSIEIVDSSGTVITTSTMASGSTMVTVNADETYTISATNGAGTTNADVSVTILTAPTIDTFTVTQATDVEIGQTITFDWTVTGATTVTIENSGGTTLKTSSLGTDSYLETVAGADTYTLTATNAAGSTTDTITTTLRPAPSIVSFTASSSTDIVPGSMISLSWQATQTDAVAITDSSGSTVVSSTSGTGSAMVTVNADETYTLTVSNPNGNDTDTVSVTVLVAPTVTSFTATPNMGLAPNDTVTLAWDVSGADSITIEDSGGNQITTSMMATGSVMTTVADDETFTITATNGAGDTTDTTAVNVVILPTITSFTATETVDVVPGTMVDLSWDVSGADSIAIEDSSGTELTSSASATGTFTVTVNADETYTLIATNSDGSASDPIAITVLPTPTINSFAASSNSVAAGTMVDLSWDVTGADSILIEDSAGNDLTTSTNATGTFTVTVNSGETYTLTATNAAGDSQANETVLVPAVVDTFTADSTNSISGGAIVLSWTTTSATSATVTGDQGVTNYSVPMGDVASGSLTVRPQVTTVYTIEATNADGSDTATVTITVDAAPLYITEVFYDAASIDTDLEWVEIYNAGDTFVDLDNYSLGAGGNDYTTETYQFSGIIIAPGQTVVVGGPLSNVDNGTPALDQSDPITMQNGGAESDGVALFFELATNLTAATAPIDKVVYDSPNTNNLINESGMAATELSPDVTAGNSLVRAGLSDVFIESSALQPNLPIYVSSLSVTRGPNESTESFTINGFGFDANLDQVQLGTANVNCTNSGLDSMACNLAATTTQTGDVDLTITRVNEYVADVNGDPVISALAVGDQRTYTLTNAFFFEGRITTLPPSGFTGFYCSSFVASPPVIVTVSTPVTVTGLLYVQGFTEVANSNTVPSGWSFEVGYLTRGDVPYQVYDAFWTPTTSQADDSVNPDNELLSADVTSAVALQSEVGFRVSPDGGTNWIYCDSQSKNNPGTNVVDWEEGDFVEWQ